MKSPTESDASSRDEARGRIALVTGGSRGLGQAFALGLAGRGDTVVAVARSEEQLHETEALADELPGSVVGITCDISDHRAVARLADEVRASVGKPSIVVNAAGIFGSIDLVADADPEHWTRTIMVDAVAAFYTSTAFVGDMLDARWGRIVSVTSAASLHPPGPLNSAYGTAKAALNQFTRHLASEIAGSGVTANVIHPGDVKTSMWADIRERVAGMGAAGENYRAWAEWVDETGGDPPQKAVDLVLRLTSDAGADSNGMFCWIDEPLQAPIPSWDPPTEDRPWMED